MTNVGDTRVTSDIKNRVRERRSIRAFSEI